MLRSLIFMFIFILSFCYILNLQQSVMTPFSPSEAIFCSYCSGFLFSKYWQLFPQK
jgi:hypothetical protein